MRFASACLALFAATTAAAQTSSYDLLYNEKPLGHDVVKLSTTKQGFKLTSRFSYRGSGPASDGDFLDEYKLTPTYALDEALLSNEATNGATSYVLNKKRDSVTIAYNQVETHQTAVVDIQSNFFILPPFDAGAAQALLLNLAQPGAAATLNLIAQPDPHAPATLSAEQHTARAQWIAGPDLEGTLDSQPVTVHTYMLAIPRAQWLLLADSSNNLLECSLPALRLTYVRQYFHLTSPFPPLTAFKAR
jgi:hypothetical protein